MSSQGKDFGVRKASRAFVAMEACAAAAIAGAGLAAGAPALGVALGIGALSLGVRVAGLGALSAKAAGESARAGSPWPKLGALGWAKFAVRGGAIAARVHWLELAWGPAWSPDAEIAAAKGRPGPLAILVPGYACGQGPMGRWARRIDLAGGVALRFEYSKALGSIDGHAMELAKFAARVRAELGRDPFFVGHSMGGLTSLRAALDGAPCAGVMAVGSPLEGTLRSASGKGESAAQMAPGSAWLSDLASRWRLSPPAPMMAVWSSCDPIVSPNLSASGRGWPVERSARWDGVGHLEQLGSDACAKAVAAEFMGFAGKDRSPAP